MVGFFMIAMVAWLSHFVLMLGADFGTSSDISVLMWLHSRKHSVVAMNSDSIVTKQHGIVSVSPD